MTHIASLSGGQDSTAMVVRMLELGMQLDYIIFCDTGAEFDVMYKYLLKLDDYLQRKFGKHITYLKKTNNGVNTYEDVVKFKKTDRAAEHRRGKPKGITSIIMVDECTRKLKVDRSNQFIRKTLKLNIKKDVVQYHGYTFNEVKKDRGGSQERMKENYRYPLYEWKWNEPQVSKYLQDKSIFNPLYKHYTRTGCFLCPKQSRSDWFNLWKYYPHHFEYAKELEQWCIDNDAVQKYFLWDFKTDTELPLIEFEKECKLRDKQGIMNFDDHREDISCFCK